MRGAHDLLVGTVGPSVDQGSPHRLNREVAFDEAGSSIGNPRQTAELLNLLAIRRMLLDRLRFGFLLDLRPLIREDGNLDRGAGTLAWRLSASESELSSLTEASNFDRTALNDPTSSARPLSIAA